MPLPMPIGRQKEVLRLPASGHVAVLGTAGSGKTTLAILRSAFLSDPETDHNGKTLLVTFNRALVAYLKHLQDRKLENVTVENYHKFARGYLASRGKMSFGAICDPDERTAYIKQAVSKVATRYEKHTFFATPLEFFVDEFTWMSQHGIFTLDGYQDATRIGRSTTRISQENREIAFQVFEEYRQIRSSRGKTYDWDDLASTVREELANDESERLYRHVVIDEGQDFSPQMIASLADAIPENGSLTFFGDMAQQILSWFSVIWKNRLDELASKKGASGFGRRHCTNGG